MNTTISQNTQAILLLTAPLIAGRGSSSPDLLTPGEYKRLARHLRELQRQPADLLSPDSDELLHICQPVIDRDRLQRLLGRGFLLSQVIERWQTRAIWVVSRADMSYPRILKTRLREDAPAVLYGCGDISLLKNGGLAVVGSRHVDDELIEYTMNIGQLTARAGRTLVSGGAKGIDQAAMRGALESGGRVAGVLSDSLEKMAMNREHRNLLMDGQLVLTSPYDPNAGFNVGNAMQRNKLIYALADAALVVNTDLNQGGTWAGAKEQLDKFKFVPVYVRSTGSPCKGLDALRQKGALPWTNPQDPDTFAAVFDVPHKSDSGASLQTSLPLFTPETSSMVSEVGSEGSQLEDAQKKLDKTNTQPSPIVSPPNAVAGSLTSNSSQVRKASGMPPERKPADALFATVRGVLEQMLLTPKKETEVAAILQVTAPQAKAWLQRLLEEGSLEKINKPVRYVIKGPTLLKLSDQELPSGHDK